MRRMALAKEPIYKSSFVVVAWIKLPSKFISPRIGYKQFH
jgi:hypothetical protein